MKDLFLILNSFPASTSMKIKIKRWNSVLLNKPPCRISQQDGGKSHLIAPEELPVYLSARSKIIITTFFIKVLTLS